MYLGIYCIEEKRGAPPCLPGPSRPGPALCVFLTPRMPAPLTALEFTRTRVTDGASRNFGPALSCPPSSSFPLLERPGKRVDYWLLGVLEVWFIHCTEEVLRLS